MSARALYICYFGLLEPLVQTQVLPYLRELKKDGHDISLVTFEPDIKQRWPAAKVETIKRQLEDEGIRWDLLPYHKRFSVIATGYDILRGAIYVRRRISRDPVDILHGRVHIPVLMAALARRFSRSKPKILFDIRGFFPEEYTDAGRWPENGWLFRSAKRIEKWLLKESDGFVVLTEKAREILFPESKAAGLDKMGRPVEVIPCCVDMSRFGSIDDVEREASRERLGVGSRKVIAYVGSFGGWYMTDEMIDFFTAAREADSSVFAMILTQRDKDSVRRRLLAAGFGHEDILVETVDPEEIPDYLCAADVAVSFIKACYSKLSSSPTKIAEYLACGVPVVANRGVGDIDHLIQEHRVGQLLQGFTNEDYRTAFASITGRRDLGGRCRGAAKAEFDLEGVGGPRYRRIYTHLLGAVRSGQERVK